MNVEPGYTGNSPRRNSRLFIILAAVLGVGVVAVVIFLLIPGPTPEEVARKWAVDNVDAAGEEIAGFILGTLGKEGLEGKVLTELGGEWIEDRINEHLAWTFSTARPDGAGNQIVIATGSVEFQVSRPPINGRVQAALPFRLLIDGSNVVDEQVILADASFDAELTGIDTQLIPSGIDAGIEKAEEGVDKLKGLLGQ